LIGSLVACLDDLQESVGIDDVDVRPVSSDASSDRLIVEKTVRHRINVVKIATDQRIEFSTMDKLLERVVLGRTVSHDLFDVLFLDARVQVDESHEAFSLLLRPLLVIRAQAVDEFRVHDSELLLLQLHVGCGVEVVRSGIFTKEELSHWVTKEEVPSFCLIDINLLWLIMMVSS